MNIFRILIGSNLSTQTKHVEEAIKYAEAKYGDEIQFESLSIQKILVDLNWTHNQLIQWFDEATYVIISSHPLQNDFGPYWDYSAFLDQLREVFKKKGRHAFPPHTALRAACTQDKWEIYQALHQYMLPSFRINRKTLGEPTLLEKDTLCDLYRFCISNYEVHSHHSGGWHIKLGFSTGNKGNISTSTISSVPSRILTLFNKTEFLWKPYIFVQQTLDNTVEVKVCFINNPHDVSNHSKGMYVCYNDKHGKGLSFRSKNDEHLFAFVALMKEIYESKYGEESTIPVFRCDVMIAQDGRMVVNEIEHFEAVVVPSSSKGAPLMASKFEFILTEFWKQQVLSMIELTSDKIFTNSCLDCL